MLKAGLKPHFPVRRSASNPACHFAVPDQQLPRLRSSVSGPQDRSAHRNAGHGAKRFGVVFNRLVIGQGDDFGQRIPQTATGATDP